MGQTMGYGPTGTGQDGTLKDRDQKLPEGDKYIGLENVSTSSHSVRTLTYATPTRFFKFFFMLVFFGVSS